MPSTFFGIEIGSRALTTSQLALDVIGQNTSNVNTPGYSRQVVNLDATDAYSLPDQQPTSPRELGTGVQVTSVTRVRDAFLDSRVQAALSDQGAIDNLKSITGRVEQAYGEPSTTGIGALTTKLLNSFSDLTANPESEAIRATVLNNAQTLVAAFHSLNTALNQINPELVAKINSKVKDVNDIASQIAILNQQIGLSLASGDHPNDLQDKRGALINQLSSLVNIQVTNTINPQTGQPSGKVQIGVGGFALVQDDSYNKLPATLSTGNGQFGLVTATNNTIPLQGGEIFGLIKATTLVTGYQADLNALASNLVSSVNAIHKTGYGLNGLTNNQFFADPPPGGTVDAGSIVVSTAVTNSLDAIAAAASVPTTPGNYSSGNGDNARAIASLTSQPIAALGNFSLNDYYNSKVALVGADSQSYISQSDNQSKVVNLLQTQQSSVSGVNLDEELTKMMSYQRTYQAAARIISTMDAVLGTIINNLGSVAGGG